MLESCGTTRLGALEVMVLSPSVINRHEQLILRILHFAELFIIFIAWIATTVYLLHIVLVFELFGTGQFHNA